MTREVAVKTSYANIYSKPSFSSEMVTQALFFEKLSVISEEGNWAKIAQWDGYKGFVHKFYISEDYRFDGIDIVIKDRYLPLYNTPDLIDVAMYIPFASTVSSKKEKDEKFSICIESARFYYSQPTFANNKSTRKDITDYCRNLIGSPYLWGGKTPFGYDCSGFVQSVFKAAGLEIERDTRDQIKNKSMASIDINNARPGDLVFFNLDGNNVDHVGILNEDNSVFHCSGQVKEQTLNHPTPALLQDYILDVRSIEGMINEQ